MPDCPVCDGVQFMPCSCLDGCPACDWRGDYQPCVCVTEAAEEREAERLREVLSDHRPHSYRELYGD